MKSTQYFLNDLIILSDNKQWNYNWDLIETIPEFVLLSETEQPERWHGEGNVMKHTILTCCHALRFVQRGNYFRMLNGNDFYIKRCVIFLGAALFHDIGKFSATKRGEDGKIHAYSHEIIGEKITRKMLWDVDVRIREAICSLVRWHMEPLNVWKSNNYERKILQLIDRTDIEMLLDLKKCDVAGSIIKSKEDLYKSLCGLSSLDEFLRHFQLSKSRTQFAPSYKPRITDKSRRPAEVYVMVGLPGSGKTTYANNLSGSGFVVISRDKLRIELGYCKEGEKKVLSSEVESKITEKQNDMIIESIKCGKIPVIDNLNIKRKYRDSIKELLYEFDVKYTYVYCQATTIEKNFERRRGQIDEEVIFNMIESFDFPSNDEYNDLILHLS